MRYVYSVLVSATVVSGWSLIGLPLWLLLFCSSFILGAYIGHLLYVNQGATQ